MLGGGLGGDANINTTGIITAGAFFTTGIITATNFVGSGEGLTGVASTDNIQTATDATFLANVNISGITTLANTNISGLTTATNKIEVRSDDGSEGRIDFYCEVSNAHYTRIQGLLHMHLMLEMLQLFYQIQAEHFSLPMVLVQV